MATNDIKYVLNVQLADNTVTVENKDDKIAVLVSAGTADFKRVVSEIMEVNPGLERETVEAVLNLEKRVVKKLLLTGFRVNTGGLNASSLKGYNESNIISAIKSGYPVLGRGNSGKKRYLVFVSDGKEDMLGFMMVSLLHLKMENLTISSTVIGDGVAIKMATISVKPLILMQVPQSMIHLTNNQVKLQTINITLNIQS